MECGVCVLNVDWDVQRKGVRNFTSAQFVCLQRSSLVCRPCFSMNSTQGFDHEAPGEVDHVLV